MWDLDEVEFVELLIRGREYDPHLFGIRAVMPPRPESPFWEIEFKDGTKMITTDVVTVRIRENKENSQLGGSNNG